MADLLKNVRLFNGGCDLTGTGNKIDIQGEGEERDVTTWGSYDEATDSIWKEVLLGNKQAKIAGAGLWSAGDPSQVDDTMWANLGGLGSWTACPHGAAVGAVGWVTNALEGQYQLLGQQGEVAPWSGSWSTTWPLVRGVIAHPPGTARTATGNGTAVQHVAVPAGKELIAALHVLSVAGTSTPTLTVKIQSDDASGFSSPTDRVTFDAATAVGGQAARLGGPWTDTYYRATWTISGTTPSFLFVVSLGVA